LLMGLGLPALLHLWFVHHRAKPSVALLSWQGDLHRSRQAEIREA
jgi:hypothetical protein